MKKKLFASIIALFCFVLASCGQERNQTTADGRMVLDYWVLFGGGDLEFMEQIVDDYNEEQDDVYINLIFQDFDEYYTKLTTSVAADRGPDIAISHATTLPELVNQGLALPVDDVAEQAGIDWSAFNENILEGVEMEGQIYGVPIDVHPSVMYLNMPLAEEAGMVDEEGEILLEETPDGFKEFLTRPIEAGMEETAFSFPTGGVDAFRIWWALYHQMGGSPIFEVHDLNDVDVSIDEDIAVEAVQYLHDLFYEEEVIPLHLADFYQEFQNENAVSIVTGVWSTGIWEEADMDFAAYPFPTLYDQEGMFGNSHTMILPLRDETSEERQVAALEFMEYVASEGALTWTQAGHIPVHLDTIESEEFQEIPYRSDYVEVADQVEFPPPSIYYRPAQTEMERAMDEILSGRVDPEQGIEDMIEELEIITN